MRRAPLVGTAGEPLACTLEVRNTGRFSRTLLELEDHFAGGTGRAVAARMKPGVPERLECVVESPRRGVYSGGEVKVESAAPFGLLSGRRSLRVSASATIYPRTFEVAGLPRPASSEAAESGRDEASTPHRGAGGEFWGVREYRPGDPARLIAWRQSARSISAGRLAVMEMARETDTPFTVALDLDALAPREAREMVVSAAASLLLHALREGREAAADAGEQRAPFPENPDADAVLSWCAALEPSRPSKLEEVSVKITPSLRHVRAGDLDSETVALVSCHEFAGPGPWMTQEEERAFMDAAEAAGKRAVRLGPDLREPWRIT